MKIEKEQEHLPKVILKKNMANLFIVKLPPENFTEKEKEQLIKPKVN